MSIRLPIEELKPLMAGVVWAIQKGIGEDIREYLASGKKETNNAIILMRGDNINTNLRNFVITDTVELKAFKRSAWNGRILIDRRNKVTVTICTKQTLESIPKKKNRTIPHFLQSILFVQNRDLVAPVKQMCLGDYTEFITVFSDDEYEADYASIMEDEINFDDGYLHCVVVYETEHYQIKSIAMRFLDKDMDVVREEPLMDLLKPNFGDLTIVEGQDEQKRKHDVHSLVSVKASIEKEDSSQRLRSDIIPKKEETEKQD